MKLPVFTDPTSGEPSFSLTVAAVTFTVVLVRWCIGGLDILGHTFQPVSNDSITTWLTPTLLAYVARKATGAAVDIATTKAGG